MNDIMRDITSVGMAIIGVAILTVLVSQKNQTSQVIGAASSGFANVLGVAMGGANSSSMSVGEIESNCPKPWPAQYQWRLMGIGAMPRFQLGYTTPTFNNQMAPMSVGYNTLMPGLNRTPFGGN
jgi:hypothetical protein